MLQIASGKLFSSDASWSNKLTGVIQTNLTMIGDEEIETAAGKVSATSFIHGHKALIYTFDEKMEGEEGKTGVICSHGIEPYILDFSVIFSFAMNCIATPDYDLLRRLSDGQRSFSVNVPANKLIKRFFDREILVKPDEIEFFNKFCKQLIGLERRKYLSVMRAIRTYITAMHRLKDDLELSYTLMVAALESLAQDIDGKKNKEKLQERFINFVLQNTSKGYYRRDVQPDSQPASRFDLKPALKQAYDARSSYIHNLMKLPKILSLSNSYNETCVVDGDVWLTFQGLSNLFRHVVFEFVFKQVTVEKETYNYSDERAGIVTLPLSPEYWLARTDNFNKEQGYKRLNGFLSMLASYCLKPDTAKVVDLTDLLSLAKTQLPQMKKEERKSWLVLYFLFDVLRPKDNTLKKLEDRYVEELSIPTIENLISYLIINGEPAWDIKDYQSQAERYIEQRYHKKGIRLPRLFEAALFLYIAEQCRKHEQKSEVAKYISDAVEAMPEHLQLRSFEECYLIESNLEINWQEVLLPVNNEKA